MSGFFSDIHKGITGLDASIGVRVVYTKVVENNDTVIDRREVRKTVTIQDFDNHDHIRFDDEIQIDPVNNVPTRPVRVKLKESVEQIRIE